MSSRHLTGLAVLCASLLSLPSAFVAAQDAAPSAAAKKADPWQPVRVLLGAWEGDSQGQPGAGKCEREYRLTLKDRFIQVNNKSTYPPQEKNPKGETHE